MPIKSLIDFNDTKDRYRENIEQSIKFAGATHDYYIKAKAEALLRVLAEYVPHLARPDLLDVGCGHGLIHPYLAPHATITGTDIAGEVLSLAQQENPHVNYTPYDGATLPFGDGTFDIALAICVMHHVPPAQWDRFMLEMKRVVRPGGIVVVFEHNPYNPITRYVVAHCPLDEGVTLLSFRRMQRLMNAAGLKEVISHHMLFTPFSTRLDRALKWCPLGAQYYTVGRVA